MPHETPGEIEDLAQACLRYVQRALSLPLDFTPDTLPLLDHYLQQLGEPHGPEIVALVAPAAGAYFGEVVGRSLGGTRWHTAGEDYAGYRLEFAHCFLHFNPVGQALEAIQQRAVEGYHAHLGLRAQDAAQVEAALARLGDVRDDDYYRLSTRFEVIEQVVVTLTSAQVASGEPPTHFDAAYYQHAVAEVAAAEARGGRSN